jgi:hypothetical protein
LFHAGLVGAAGFEPATPSPPDRYRYSQEYARRRLIGPGGKSPGCTILPAGARHDPAEPIERAARIAANGRYGSVSSLAASQLLPVSETVMEALSGVRTPYDLDFSSGGPGFAILALKVRSVSLFVDSGNDAPVTFAKDDRIRLAVALASSLLVPCLSDSFYLPGPESMGAAADETPAWPWLKPSWGFFGPSPQNDGRSPTII